MKRVVFKQKGGVGKSTIACLMPFDCDKAARQARAQAAGRKRA